jgi:hypothetical protein
MPLFDALGGTINSRSWELQKVVDQGIFRFLIDGLV